MHTNEAEKHTQTKILVIVAAMYHHFIMKFNRTEKQKVNKDNEEFRFMIVFHSEHSVKCTSWRDMLCIHGTFHVTKN